MRHQISLGCQILPSRPSWGPFPSSTPSPCRPPASLRARLLLAALLLGLGLGLRLGGRRLGAEVQPGVPGRVGQGGDAAVVLVLAAIEGHLLHAGRQGPPGNRRSRPRRPPSCCRRRRPAGGLLRPPCSPPPACGWPSRRSPGRRCACDCGKRTTAAGCSGPSLPGAPASGDAFVVGGFALRVARSGLSDLPRPYFAIALLCLRRITSPS